MTRGALRTCASPGCSNLVQSGRCENCTRQAQKGLDERRGSARSRGYDRRWEKAREAFIQRHPLCHHCHLEGAVTPTWCVDHVIPHRGNTFLFWLPGNWQPLCKPHHDAKSLRENGLAKCSHPGECWVGIGTAMVCVWCGERRDDPSVNIQGEPAPFEECVRIDTHGR